MYVVVFKRVGRNWRACVPGYYGFGRTKRLAQAALKKQIEPDRMWHFEWVDEDSSFFKR